MDIKVSGRKTTVTDALRAHVDEKIGEALKVFDIEPMTVDVVLRYEKNPSNPNPAIVEVTVRARGSVIRVAEHGADMYAAIDLSADKVTRQLRKFKTKVVDNRQGGASAADVAPVERVEDLADLLLASCSPEIRSNKTLRSLLGTTYKVLVIILGVATCAQIVGFPIGSIVAGAGLVGLTISLAAQDMAKNFFSGVVILLDKPFSIGDWITVGDVEGEVVDINFRSTKVRAVDNSIYILTNSTVSSATINNATLRNKRLYRFTLGVTYDTTRPQLEKLMADLTAMLKASPDAYEDTAFVRMTGFGDSSINLMVSAYLRTADLGVFLRMQNDLNLNIMDVMKADGVDFAFPSTTVYLAKEN